MNKSLLYALQIREADIPWAIRNAELHSLFRPYGTYEFADCLIVYRKDCPRSEKLENLLSRSFDNVSIYHVKRSATGHPAGPNAMWCDLMQELYALKKTGRLKAECVLTTEADAIPTVLDWDSSLLNAWRRENVRVAGHHMEYGDHDCGHINGNALFMPDIAKLSSKLNGCSDYRSWDTWLAPVFQSLGWADIPEIRNWYGKIDVTDLELRSAIDSGCAWLHGVKDNSAALLVEEWAKSSQQFLMSRLPRLP
jgi:hypothetical protein